MKTRILRNFFATLLVVSTLSATAQWGTSGNLGLSGSNYIGTNDGVALKIYTNSSPRAVITSTGFFGLKETNPIGNFHMTDGSMYLLGNGGYHPLTIPDGSAFIWFGGKYAVRSGEFLGANLQTSDVGKWSFAQGYHCWANSDKSIAMGDTCRSEAKWAVSMGYKNVSSGMASTTFGRDNNATAMNSFAAGIGNDATDTGAIALGDQNVSSGHDAVALGELCEATGDFSLAAGWRSKANDRFAIALGDSCVADNECSLAMGWDCDSYGKNTAAIGTAVESTAATDHAYGFGSYLKSSADSSVVIGVGVSESLKLENDMAQTLMVGFNSDEPTFFVNGGDGTSGSYGNVGIATTNPEARLEVALDVAGETTDHSALLVDMEASDGANRGIEVNIDANASDETHGFDVNITDGSVLNYGGVAHVTASTSTTNNIGLLGQAEATTTHDTADNYGVSGIANNGEELNVGVHGAGDSDSDFIVGLCLGGLFTATGSSNFSQGVNGQCTGTGIDGYGGLFTATGNTSNRNFGVFAQASNSSGDNWAIWSAGNTWTPSGAWTGSDENLKSGIEDLESASSKLVQLQPKTYYFNNEYTYMGFDDRKHYGIMAQNLEEVFPEMVKDVTHSAQYDENHELTHEAVDFKSVRMAELIPVLVAGFNEQQATIESLQAQLNSIVADMDACCANKNSFDSGMNDIQILQPGDEGFQDGIDDHKLDQNIPNPFDSNTTINYFLACDCTASVKVYNATGQLIDVLVDQTHSYGAHTIQWNASNLSEGIYYYTLVVDGTEMVKRAVKMK
jgi:hypothetical protein